jgi:Fe-S-cluster containining protein
MVWYIAPMKPDVTNALEDRAYFFDAGLSFECLQCGDCCIGAPGTIYVSGAEIDAIADHLRLSQDAFRNRFLYPFKDSYSIREDRAGRCLFYDGGCTIYDHRPHQCRTFPFWFGNLRSEKRWQTIAGQCPGIGRGRVYAREEILQIAVTTLQI